LLKC